MPQGKWMWPTKIWSYNRGTSSWSHLPPSSTRSNPAALCTRWVWLICRKQTLSWWCLLPTRTTPPVCCIRPGPHTRHLKSSGVSCSRRWSGLAGGTTGWTTLCSIKPLRSWSPRSALRSMSTRSSYGPLRDLRRDSHPDLPHVPLQGHK